MNTTLPMLAMAGAACLLAALHAPPASAQPTEFPPDAVPLTEASLDALAGKRYVGQTQGGQWRQMDFGPDRSYRVSFRNGILDGKLRLEGDKLCQDMRKTIESSCNEVRVKDNQLFYKRVYNGEVITLVAQ